MTRILTALALGLALTACDTPEPEPMQAWYEQTSREATQDLFDRIQTLRDAVSAELSDPELLSLLDRLDEAEKELKHVATHRTQHPEVATRLVAIEDELSAIEQELYDGPEDWVDLRYAPHPQQPPR